MAEFTLEYLWDVVGFSPNERQREAIEAGDGPLFLTAGPGSGKTRVLLWRVVNLIVFKGVDPNRIFLGTFTEKGAHQLREGLRGLLAVATDLSGKQYDISRMAIGTIHSNCHRILQSRALMKSGERPLTPILLDELKQFRTVYSRRVWEELTHAAGITESANTRIIGYLGGNVGQSHVEAVRLAVGFFNRCSEEAIDPEKVKPPDDDMANAMLKMCAAYRRFLNKDPKRPFTDLSLLQQHAWKRITQSDNGNSLFDHVIIDEYQDTNAIQEMIYFRLAEKTKNLCVVGDDDQALYRFRGATVDNFLAFPGRCKAILKSEARQIPLVKNYRSRGQIVHFYNSFMEQTNWERNRVLYRVPKTIEAASKDESNAVFLSSGEPTVVAAEVAAVVKALIVKKRVKDPNEIAFLFPSLSVRPVQHLRDALEAQGLKVYAPRAGSFLDVKEALEVLGVFLLLFGKPNHVHPEFENWMTRARQAGGDLLHKDNALAQFVKDRQEQMLAVLAEEEALLKAAAAVGCAPDSEWTGKARKAMERAEVSPQLSRFFAETSKSLNAYIRHQRERRADRPITVQYVVNRACSLDWGVLNLFYELTTFEAFKDAFDLAEAGTDEGPICNLALLSDYLSHFQEETSPVISAQFLRAGRFSQRLFSNYLYTLHRLGEGEYEDKEDPFPKGRIPFLTVHQAKGLEFPVVVLGSTRKDQRPPSKTEQLVSAMRKKAEPLDAAVEFDIARMFYVAISRPKQALILCRYEGRGQRTNAPFIPVLAAKAKALAKLDLAAIVPDINHGQADIPRPYSFTGDYIGYNICPRRYMLYRRYGLAPSRSQTMVFGNLVHQTIEDLHQWIIHRRDSAAKV